jgi:hypothetical protein
MFCNATAKENSAAVMPTSRIMWGCSNPKLCRMPMAKLSMMAAPPKMLQIWTGDKSVYFIFKFKRNGLA